eukprot:scaffold76143_cov23-Tisochrysis_lutea.AAC.1
MTACASTHQVHVAGDVLLRTHPATREADDDDLLALRVQAIASNRHPQQAMYGEGHPLPFVHTANPSKFYHQTYKQELTHTLNISLSERLVLPSHKHKSCRIVKSRSRFSPMWQVARVPRPSPPASRAVSACQTIVADTAGRGGYWHRMCCTMQAQACCCSADSALPPKLIVNIFGTHGDVNDPTSYAVPWCTLWTIEAQLPKTWKKVHSIHTDGASMLKSAMLRSKATTFASLKLR